MAEEDSYLRELVQKHGIGEWKTIAQTLTNTTGVYRRGKQCRERWQHKLAPTLIMKYR